MKSRNPSVRWIDPDQPAPNGKLGLWRDKVFSALGVNPVAMAAIVTSQMQFQLFLSLKRRNKVAKNVALLLH